MKTIALEIPEALLWQSGASREEIKRQSQFLLALKLFEVGQITSGQAAALSGQSRVAFLFEASQNGVAVADLDPEELAAEVAQAKCA